MFSKTKRGSLSTCILTNDEVLREELILPSDGTSAKVFLPLDSTYAVRVKNMDSRKAIVTLRVAGEKITEAELESEASITLDRFLDSDRSFAFTKIPNNVKSLFPNASTPEADSVQIVVSFVAPKTTTVQVLNEEHDYRGSRTTPRPSVPSVPKTPIWIDPEYLPGKYEYVPSNRPIITWASDNTAGTKASVDSSGSVRLTTTPGPIPLGEAPKIVRVKSKHDEELEDHMVFHYKLTERVEPKTTRTKIQCEVCETKSASSAKFCANCGNRLV